MPDAARLGRAVPPGGGWATRLGSRLARHLAARRHAPGASPPPEPARLAACLRPCDVLLVEGDTRFSVGIKYLTQSTWSHAALYIGARLGDAGRAGFVEADVVDGVRAVGLDTYSGLHVRICRPVGLTADEAGRVIDHAVARLGHRYDLRHIVDLVRWLLPTPPVPVRWRRRMIALGSGDPTRAICSTLLAQAFQSVRYPILPTVEHRLRGDPDCATCTDEVLHLRHHSLFVPRDFDVSPYFDIVKPTLAAGFDHHRLAWADHSLAEGAVAMRAPADAHPQESCPP